MYLSIILGSPEIDLEPQVALRQKEEDAIKHLVDFAKGFNDNNPKTDDITIEEIQNIQETLEEGEGQRFREATFDLEGVDCSGRPGTFFLRIYEVGSFETSLLF
jgi:hypothetical protein